MLIGHALGVERAWLGAHGEEDVDAARVGRIDSLLLRRRNGEPVAYLLGEREFYGLGFEVTPDVLIPRPETELLIDHALALAQPRARVLDLGTGSGAIAVALVHERPDLSVTACDASPGALAVAARNASRHKAAVRLVESDWFSAVEGRFDLIVANPPYIAAGDPHLAQGDLRYEPRNALEAGAGGMECIEAIATAARARLSPGWLLIEHGFDQGDRCVALLKRLGYEDVLDHRDLAGQPRLVQGRFDPSAPPR